MKDIQTHIQEQIAHNQWGFLGSQGHVMGIDLGSYGLRAALIDLNKRSFISLDSGLTNENPDQFVDGAIALGRELLQTAGVGASRLVRLGVGFGGPVDMRHGTIRFSPRATGWENYPLQERFEQAFDAVTLVDNDANLIALGEASFGIGKDYNHLFYMHLSSGVGGGIVLDGRLYHGATSTAGEIGHAIVGLGWDGSGEPATLEELVSIAGLTSRAQQLGFATENLEDIFSDHPVGQRTVQEAVGLLATRIAQTVALLDPKIVVLGGITVRIGGEKFVAAIRDQVMRFIAPQFARPIEVVASMLGPDSVTVGALALALDSLRD